MPVSTFDGFNLLFYRVWKQKKVCDMCDKNSWLSLTAYVYMHWLRVYLMDTLTETNFKFSPYLYWEPSQELRAESLTTILMFYRLDVQHQRRRSCVHRPRDDNELDDERNIDDLHDSRRSVRRRMHPHGLPSWPRRRLPDDGRRSHRQRIPLRSHAVVPFARRGARCAVTAGVLQRGHDDGLDCGNCLPS